MRRLIILGTVCVLAAARPELYKEKEDFQYARSSSDEGSKSGYYGAQRGNMGGNYERAHNMDSLAQHQMSGLVRQVEGELGDGANTRVGSVYTAANSRGTYGSGHFDLSNLAGRNFQEGTSYDDSHSRSSLSSVYNNAGYANSRSQSSRHNGYQTAGHSNLNMQTDDLQALDNTHGSSLYDYGRQSSHSSGYQSQSGFREHSEYDMSNANSHAGYGSNVQTRLVSATPVRIIVRPGGRVAVPIAAHTYDAAHDSTSVDQNSLINSETELLNNGHQRAVYRPGTAKHYEASYNYRKEWEKHDTIPSVIPLPTPTATVPVNSELYEDSNLHTSNSQYDASRTESQRAHSSNMYNGYNANVKTASQSRANYDTHHRASVDSATNAYTLAAHNAGSSHHGVSADSNSYSQHNSGSQYLGTAANSKSLTRSGYDSAGANVDLNSQVEDINSKPKSYQSSFSYHKSWERQGDPYVIKPASGAYYDGQSFTKNQGSHYQQLHQSQDAECDENGHIRVARSYNTDQYQQQSQNLEDFGQQAQDLTQIAQQRNWNQQETSQQTQNSWDDLESLNQQSQKQWDRIEDLGQQSQKSWDNLEDLSQQSQHKWDRIEDLGQQTANWNQEDFGQQTQELKNLDQQTQNSLGEHAREKGLPDITQQNLQDFGQQNLQDFTQQNLQDFGQQNSQDFSQENVQDFGQQNLQDFGQQNLQDFGQQNLQDFGQQNVQDSTQQNIQDFGQQNLQDFSQQNVQDFGQQNIQDFGQQGTDKLDKTLAAEQQTQQLNWNRSEQGQEKANERNEEHHRESVNLSKFNISSSNSESIQKENDTQNLHKVNMWDSLHNNNAHQNVNQNEQHTFDKHDSFGNNQQTHTSWSNFDTASQMESHHFATNHFWNQFSDNAHHRYNNQEAYEQSNTRNIDFHSQTHQDKFDIQSHKQEETINANSHSNIFEGMSSNSSPLSSLWNKLDNIEQVSLTDKHKSDKGQVMHINTSTQSSYHSSKQNKTYVIETSTASLHSEVHLQPVQDDKIPSTSNKRPQDIGRGDISSEDLLEASVEHKPASEESTNNYKNDRDDKLSSNELRVLGLQQTFNNKTNDVLNAQNDSVLNSNQNAIHNMNSASEGQTQISTPQEVDKHYTQEYGNVEHQNFEGFRQQNSEEFTQQNLQDFGQQNLQDFGQQNVQDFGQQNLQDFGQQNLQDFGQQNVQDITQQNLQDFSQQNLQDFGQQNIHDIRQQNEEDFGQQHPDNFGQQSLQGFGQQNSQNYGDQKLHAFGQQENLEDNKHQNSLTSGHNFNNKQTHLQDNNNEQHKNLELIPEVANQEKENQQKLHNFDQLQNQDQQQWQGFEQQIHLEQQQRQDFNHQTDLGQSNKQDYGQHYFDEQQNLQVPNQDRRQQNLGNYGPVNDQLQASLIEKELKEVPVEEPMYVQKQNMDLHDIKPTMPEEPVTEKPGFWSRAKSKISSWFRS